MSGQGLALRSPSTVLSTQWKKRVDFANYLHNPPIGPFLAVKALFSVPMSLEAPLRVALFPQVLSVELGQFPAFLEGDSFLPGVADEVFSEQGFHHLEELV